MILPAPAKINWFLHIIGQRADGYHLLQTGFQFLCLHDTLDFSLRSDGHIGIHLVNPINPGLQADPRENLIYKAAALLQPLAKPGAGIDITLNKIIPIGGGLGGGSSDAATTLLALNYLWQLKLSTPKLQQLGLQLGADVPIFIFGQAAIGEGIGERLTPYPRFEHPCLVLIPPVSILSGPLYQDKNLTRNTEPLQLQQLEQATLRNDFEPLVRTRFPEVQAAFEWLAPFGHPKLSGSGSAVFLECATLAKAEQLLAQLPPLFKGFVTQQQNVSALGAYLPGI